MPIPPQRKGEEAPQKAPGARAFPRPLVPSHPSAGANEGRVEGGRAGNARVSQGCGANPIRPRYISSGDRGIKTCRLRRFPALAPFVTSHTKPACLSAGSVAFFPCAVPLLNSNRNRSHSPHFSPGAGRKVAFFFPIHWGAGDPHARGPIIATRVTSRSNPQCDRQPMRVLLALYRRAWRSRRVAPRSNPARFGT